MPCGPPSIPAIYATHFDPFAPLTLANLEAAWQAAPFTRYLLNTVMLVTLILAAQFVLCTLAAFAFARLIFPGRDLLFAVVLLQLMVMPDVLLVENYRTLVQLHLADTILAIALPYLGSAFGIFLLRQTFLTIPQPLDDAARLEGCGLLARLWRVYVPLAKPTYIAYGLVLGQLSLEQLPLAAGDHQLGDHAAADRGPGGVRHHRPGHRLVDRHRRHADDQRAVAGCLPAVPAAVRAELHARGDQMTALADRFDTAVRLATEAAALALRMRPPPGASSAKLKGAQDWLTEADGAVERLLSERLAQAYPADGFQGEEGGSARSGSLRWVVDPIDGTANFMRGGKRFCVSLGCLDGDMPGDRRHRRTGAGGDLRRPPRAPAPR